MDAFLKILGGLALTFVVIIALIVVAIRIFLKVTVGKIKKLATAMGGPVAPVEIQLAHLDGTVPPAVERLAAELEGQGFQRIDAFGVLGMPDYELIALTKPEDDVYAAVATHPMLGPHVDLFQSAPDGRSLTVTSSKEMSPPAPIPGRTVVRRTGASIDTLLNEFRVARLTGEVNPTPPEGFASSFEAEYRRVMEFQYRQGPLKDVDVDELTRLSGMEADPKTLAFLNDLRRPEPPKEEALREAFLASGRVSATEWEAMRDWTIFVHDGLSDEEIMDTLFELGENEVEEEYFAEEGEAGDGTEGRKRFREALERMGLVDQVKLVASLNEPEPFDVYRVR